MTGFGFQDSGVRVQKFKGSKVQRLDNNRKGWTSEYCHGQTLNL
jgi:hypothetical protein